MSRFWKSSDWDILNLDNILYIKKNNIDVQTGEDGFYIDICYGIKGCNIQYSFANETDRNTYFNIFIERLGIKNDLR